MSKIAKCLKKREWAFVIITTILIISQVWLDLKLPDYMSEITKLVQTQGSQMSEILVAGGYMLACTFGSLAITIMVGYFAAQIAATVAMRMRDDVYSKTLSFSMADKNEFSTGSLITRSTNDITQVQGFIAHGYVAIIRAPFMMFWAIIKIMGKNQSFTTATVVAIVSLLAVFGTVISLAVPKTKKIQKLTDKLNTVVREHLTGVRVVRAYNAEKFQEDKFEVTNEEVASNNIFVNRATALMPPFMTFLLSSLTLSIYWIGGYLINDAMGGEKLQIFSDMIVFSSYAMQLIMSFMMLTFMMLMLPRVIVALGRISEVLDFQNKVVDGEMTESDNKTNVSVEFKNVSFSYIESEEPVLDNVSFKIEKGQTAAFIGATGSGKSTIVNLIMRFYDCTSGQILIDGLDVKSYTQNALREKLGLVSQQAILFSGDISSNIAFGVENDVDTNQLDTSVQISQAKDFVDKIGTNGEVSQGGLNLSGGQKQRLSIARAVYKNPEIYIFDDCFSALDYRTDKTLRSELLAKTKDATKLMVAQRISTVKDADQIIVLDEGKVVGIGSHKKLLEQSEVYLEIAKSQLSKEELDYA